MNTAQPKTGDRRQRLFYLIMVFTAYIFCVGYIIFFYFVEAPVSVIAIPVVAFLIFIVLGFITFRVPSILGPFRIGITTVLLAFSSLIIFTGGLRSPAFILLLIIPILSFFYKPVYDRYIFASFTTVISLSISILTYADIWITNIIPARFELAFAFICYFHFFTVFLAFVFFFSYAVRNINHKLNHSYSELKSATQKLVESEKMVSLGQLMAGIAHEINNPVNYVKGCSEELGKILESLRILDQKREELLSRLNSQLKQPGFEAYFQREVALFRQEKNKILDDDTWDVITDLLEAIEVGSTKTVGIINSLSFYSRNHYSEKVLFDINKTMETTFRIVSHKISEGITLETHYDRYAPKIYGNEGRISQVLLNILVNAIDACGKEGHIKIMTAYNRHSDYVKIAVSDTGPGIPKECEQKVFDPFFTTKEVGKGTGLGLSISKEIIEEHDGSLNFQSDSKGTTFWVILPVKKDIYE